MSIKKKSFYKIFTNIVTFLIGLVSQSIIPRVLGPASYGDFSFLTNFFISISGFLNLGSSTVFFAKLSQRQNEKGLVRFYMHFLAVFTIIMSVFVAVCFITGMEDIFWPGQRVVFIILAALFGIFTFYNMIFSDMCDAYGLTVKAELAKMAVKIIGLGIILFLFWHGILNLSSYFGYHLFVFFVPCVLLIYIIQSSSHSLFNGFIKRRDQFEPYFKEFSKVCFPLVIFLSLALMGQIFDRWFLQKFSGSANQGYYAFAYNVGAICLLVTSAVVPLVLREQSIHFGNMDFEKLKDNFSRSLGILAAITAFICCFLAIESRTIIKIFAGDAYAAAFVPMVLMCLYPILQTYGQINGNFFFATERVHIYRNTGIVATLIGAVLTFFMLGPKKFGGLEMGANGLSFKMMLLTLVSVDVHLWFNAKYLKLSFRKLFLSQITTVMIFIILAWSISVFTSFVFPGLGLIIHFLVSGIAYTFVCGIILLLRPEVIAITKNDVYQIRKFLQKGIEIGVSKIW